MGPLNRSLMLLFIWPFIRSTVLVVVYPSVLVSFFGYCCSRLTQLCYCLFMRA